MHAKRSIVVVAVLVALAGPALVVTGQNRPGGSDTFEDRLGRKVDQFFDMIQSGQTARAFSELLADGSPLARQTQQVDSLVKKTEDLEKSYGACLDVEPIGVRRIGKDVVRFEYLYKCQHYPIAWHITYYRDLGRDELVGELDTWRVVSVRFDTNLDTLAR